MLRILPDVRTVPNFEPSDNDKIDGLTIHYSKISRRVRSPPLTIPWDFTLKENHPCPNLRTPPRTPIGYVFGPIKKKNNPLLISSHLISLSHFETP